MKKLLLLMLSAVMLLTLMSCGAPEKLSPEQDHEELDVPMDVEDEYIFDALYDYLLENGLANHAGAGYHPESSMFELTPVTRWEITMTDGTTLSVNKFETDAQAEIFAANLPPSGASWGVDIDAETGEQFEIDYVYSQYWWLDGSVLYRYDGPDETAAKIAEYFGGQFAGMETLDVSDIEHAEVARLIQFINSNFTYQSFEREDISGYGFSGYEHKPIAIYTMEINDGELLYIRVYDSPETAADEAANYGGSDGSFYSFDDSQAMIIDYISPVHFWLSGDTIIQYITWNDSNAAMFDSFYGGQFAGAVITTVPDGELEVTYTDYNYFGVGFSFDYDTDLYPVIISTSHDFLNFTGDMGARFAVPPSEEMVEYYGDSFFETRTLIVIPLWESSVSDRHIVESVSKDGNTLTVNITNYDTGDEAEDFCLLFLELDGKLAYHTEIMLNRQEIFGLWHAEE